MEPRTSRPLGEVLGTGALTGLYAGFAAGMIDAVWSWAPAAQFLPGVGGRLRFVLYTALSHGAAAAVCGFMLAVLLLVMSRGTRLGDLVRFAWADHATRRARDPRDAVAGTALAITAIPVVSVTLWLTYRILLPFVSNRAVVGLVIIVTMIGTLVGLGLAVILTFMFARFVELALRPLAARLPLVSSPWLPFVVTGKLVALGLAIWAWRSWETAKILPLRGPIVGVLAALLAIPLLRPGRLTVERVGRLTRKLRPQPEPLGPPPRPRAIETAIASMVSIVLWILVFIAVLATGGSAQVIKASTAYTGLGGPIARSLRQAFDRDRDGYARFLGGGDCDDSDPSVHPGAPEIPDDGVDQNCIGGDAKTVTRTLSEVGFVPVPPAVPRDFNVLLITIDTTRADHLRTYGYGRETSPNLDKLGAEGTVFENGWAHAPSTRYSMPAILTGRLPLDVYYNYEVQGWPGLLDKATTIAELLAPLGFVTGAITNYWYFDRSRRMDQGIAEYDNENARLHNSVAGAGPEQTSGSSSQQQSDKAISFVTRHVGDRWFLWVHYYDPHYGYEPHSEVPSFGKEPVDLYDGEIRFTDLHIGRVLDELRSMGLYDKTVVVVTGDHGEGFGEHKVDFHGYHLYSAQTKVPLIIRVPGLAPRRAVTPSGHVDILPTLVNLAGGAATLDMMGHSLVDVMTGAEHEDRTVFQQLSYENNHEVRAGVGRQCHVIYNVSPETSWEVYRFDRDPLETEDLSSDDAVCRETRRAVERWYDGTHALKGARAALLKQRPVIATPLDADLGTSVRLLSVEAPATARAGEQVALTWTFEARGRVAAGWKVFCHLVGPNNVSANGDHQPDWPLEMWESGQYIRYTTAIALPKGMAGRFTLKVGLWNGTRAHVHAPHAHVDDNAVDAATIEVTP